MLYNQGAINTQITTCPPYTVWSEWYPFYPKNSIVDGCIPIRCHDFRISRKRDKIKKYDCNGTNALGIDEEFKM